MAAASASAAPSRSGGGNVVLFIHGFDPEGAADTKCVNFWDSAITNFSNSGWTEVNTSGPENDCDSALSPIPWVAS